MTLQYTPLIVPYVLVALMMGGLGVYAWRNARGREGALAFALFAFSTVVYALGEALAWMNAEVAWQYFWVRLCRPSVDLMVLFWFLFAVQYAGWGGRLNRRSVTLLAAIPIGAGLLAWTNPWHHLIWSGAHQVSWHGVAGLGLQRGPGWVVPFVYTQVLILGGAA